MVLTTDPTSSPLLRLFSFPRPKYKDHVRSIYPPMAPFSVPNVGGLLSFARSNKDCLGEIGRYLGKLVDQDVKSYRETRMGSEKEYVKCGVETYIALLENFNNKNLLCLYEKFIINMIGFLLDDNDIDFKNYGLLLFKKYASYQNNSNDITSTGYHILDQFFMHIIPLCTENVTEIKLLGLSTLSSMLEYNDNSCNHFNIILPAILSNLTYIKEDDSEGRLFELSVICLRKACTWITNDHLNELCAPLFQYLDVKKDWDGKLCDTIFNTLNENIKPRYIELLSYLLVSHIDSVPIDIQDTILLFSVGYILKMKRSVGPWQISVQFLINKLSFVIDVQIETKLIYCLGAFIVKLNSTFILWDILKLVLAAITPDLKSHNQKSLLHAALFMVKLRGTADAGLKLSDSLIFEYERLIHILKENSLVLLLNSFVSLSINTLTGAYLVPYSCETMDNLILSSENKDEDYFLRCFNDDSNIDNFLRECVAQNVFENHQLITIIAWVPKLLQNMSNELFVVVYRLLVTTFLSNPTMLVFHFNALNELLSKQAVVLPIQSNQNLVVASFCYFLSKSIRREGLAAKLSAFIKSYLEPISDQIKTTLCCCHGLELSSMVTSPAWVVVKPINLVELKEILYLHFFQASLCRSIVPSESFDLKKPLTFLEFDEKTYIADRLSILTPKYSQQALNNASLMDAFKSPSLNISDIELKNEGSDDEGTVNVELKQRPLVSKNNLSPIRSLKPVKNIISFSKFQKLLIPSAIKVESASVDLKNDVKFPSLEALNLSFLKI